MKDYPDKSTFREKHRKTITEILNQHNRIDAIEHLVDYVVSRIGNVLASERARHEEQKNIGCPLGAGRNNHGKIQNDNA